MESLHVEARYWTRAEYDRLIEIGLFHEDEPIELLGGQLVVREPQHTPHATAVRLVDEALRRVFGAGWDVRAGLPVALDDESEPEPDVCVVAGRPRDYRDAHPSRPALIVEVAPSWIVNLRERRVEVHRQPVADAAARHGWRYADVTVLHAGESVAPLAMPHAGVAVADLLP